MTCYYIGADQRVIVHVLSWQPYMLIRTVTIRMNLLSPSIPDGKHKTAIVYSV